MMTIAWHLDDLKISHSNTTEIDTLIDHLRGKYGENHVANRGDIHNYLGVEHNDFEKGVVNMSMMGPLQKVFQDFLEDSVWTSATPASDHLLQIPVAREAEASSKYLNDGKKWQFHHLVPHLLFIS